MKIFPIGDVVAASNLGALNGVALAMFEPNETCESQAIHTILQTRFGDQTQVTRKKAQPYMQIAYNYNNIFTREFRQIERAVMDVDESLTPLYVVDFSRGLTPSTVATGAAKWTVSIDDTYFYSATAGYRANRAFLWNGNSWKEGNVTGVTLNTNITVDIQANRFGGMPLGDAASGMVYPMYESYLAAQSLQNFKPGAYWWEDVKTGESGGYMYTGNVNFVSKYKV